jgi:SAM-dependent methyltransferase
VAYSRQFFKSLGKESKRSAEVIVPLLIELIRPRSVVDIGCGTGEWLATFQGAGVLDVFGIDGHWVPLDQLRIDQTLFQAADLSKPLRLNRAFDLAICLELAEHLPARAADDLVSSLVELAPVIVFSAAIPGQGGTGHVNEQWPDYWRDMFAAKGFALLDCLRERVWNDSAVQPFLAQNMLLYVAQGHPVGNGAARKPLSEAGQLPLRLVHPRVYAVPSLRRLVTLWRRGQG